MRCGFFLISLFLVFSKGAHAADSASAASDGSLEQSRLKPEASAPKLFDKSAMALGFFKEETQYRTGRRYRGTGIGFSLGYFQHIHSIWSGGIQARFSEWEGRLVADELSQPAAVIAPLSFYSKVEAAPKLSQYIGSFFENTRVSATSGFGYLQFYQRQGIPTARSKEQGSDVVFTIGAGVKQAISSGAAVRISVERWRSVRTFRYSAFIIQSEVLFGDPSGW